MTLIQRRTNTPLQFIAAELLSAFTDLTRYDTPGRTLRRLAQVERTVLDLLLEYSQVTSQTLDNMPAWKRAEFLQRASERLTTLRDLIGKLRSAEARRARGERATSATTEACL
jgi:hypothetical protein